MESKIKDIKSRLENCVIAQLDKGVENVDCEEMYKVIDMIKDLAEADYHGSIVKAMEEESEKSERMYYTPKRSRRMTPEQYRDIDYATGGRMYYTDPNADGITMHDDRMGRSGMKRKRYYEVKNSADNTTKMQTLEEYAKSLTEDVTEMVQGMNENEKQMLRTKMQTLIQKI